MTHKEVTLGNKLIVNFMGYTSIQSKILTWKEWHNPKGHAFDGKSSACDGIFQFKKVIKF